MIRVNHPNLWQLTYSASATLRVAEGRKRKTGPKEKRFSKDKQQRTQLQDERETNQSTPRILIMVRPHLRAGWPLPFDVMVLSFCPTFRCIIYTYIYHASSPHLSEGSNKNNIKGCFQHRGRSLRYGTYKDSQSCSRSVSTDLILRYIIKVLVMKQKIEAEKPDYTVDKQKLILTGKILKDEVCMSVARACWIKLS